MSKSKENPELSKTSLFYPSDAQIEEALRDYERELAKIFWFPSYCKLIAWGIAIITVVVVTVVLCLFGLTFGPTKSFIWLSTVFFALVISIFIIQPIKILLMALFSSYALKFQEAIVMKEFDLCIMKNPPDEMIKKYVTNYRMENAHLYEVTNEECLKQTGLQQQIRHRLELRLLCIDIIYFLLYMFFLYVIIFQNSTNMDFYSTDAVKDLVNRGVYNRTRPLYDVKTYEELMEYLKETLVPNLVMMYEEYPDITNQRVPFGSSYKRKTKPLTDEELEELNNFTQRQQRQTLEDVKRRDKTTNFLVTPMMKRAWTKNKYVKLMGTIRARQHRVHNATCQYHPAVHVRHFLCASDVSIYNLDTKNYGIDWRPWQPFEPQKDWDDMKPWTYMSWWDTASVMKIGRFGFYPGGGYVLNIGKTKINAELALDYIHYFRWIDHFTRVVFIEFTLYNVHTNLFNVVTLIFEKASHDVIIPSFNIHTTKFLFSHREMWAFGFFSFCCFVVLVLVGFAREYYRMRETSLLVYFTEGWTLMDLTIIIFASLVVIFYVAREYYVGHLLRQIERSSNNAFIGFHLAAYWNETSSYMATILIALSTLKILGLIKYQALFHQLEQVLRISFGQIFYLLLFMFILNVIYAMYFYPVMHPYHENFITLTATMGSLFARAAGLGGAIPLDILGINFFAPIIFFTYVVAITIILVSYFWAIFNSSVTALQRQTLWDRYSLYNYVRHKLFKKKLKVPKTNIHYNVITPRLVPQCDPPVNVSEVRMQGMKQVVLTELTGEDHTNEIMYNLAGLALSGNDQRIATDDYYRVVWEDGRKELVAHSRLEQMYEVAQEAQSRRQTAPITHK